MALGVTIRWNKKIWTGIFILTANNFDDKFIRVQLRTKTCSYVRRRWFVGQDISAAPHYNGVLSHILPYHKKPAALRDLDITLGHAAAAIIFWFIVRPLA